MSGEQRRPSRSRRDRSTVQGILGNAVTAGATAYVRSRDLPRLLALWPHEIEDRSEGGRLRLLARLRRALRAERRRARAGHWSYDLNQHLGLLSAYKGELAGLGANSSRLSRIAPAEPTKVVGCGDNGKA
jgi:hypothetical protein